ncbi:MAG: GTPase Era [Gammaproteobacteria bacterium]
MSDSFRCGYVALIGRPNVGKSTLLNSLLGRKLSITSRRPQTTRHRVVGIKTSPDVQILYVDTPGLHRHAPRAMNRYLNRAASAAIRDVDIVVFVVEGTRWTDEDELVLEKLQLTKAPVILVLNKIDRLNDKSVLLESLKTLELKGVFAHLIPLSAGSGENVPSLEERIIELLPQAPPVYPDDQLTDRSGRFLAAEYIREKLFRRLGQELPYGLTVEIERFKQLKGVAEIHALIWVEKSSQKAIVIGKGGGLLKSVGSEARRDMESLFGCKVRLKLWVKVKKGWTDDEKALLSLGYNENS